MSEQTTPKFDLMTADDKRTMIEGTENKIREMMENGLLELPPNYSVGNALNAAYLAISEAKDKNSASAMSVCSKASIAKALLTTVVLGLSPAKNQIYYIVYGKSLNAQRSYMGTAAIAKRMNGVTGEPRAQAIHEGDEVSYDTLGGYKVNLLHKQSFGNKNKPVIGAYAVITYNGQDIYEVMTIEECRKAWGMGKAKGQSPAHKNFPDEMAKKTVISRLCKMIVNTSDDSDILAQAYNETGFVAESAEDALMDVQSDGVAALGEAETLDIE